LKKKKTNILMTEARPSCATFEGSPVAKAIEILQSCSVVEVATVMESIAKGAATVDKYERFHAAALKIWRHGRGRPALYDDTKSLDEMESLLRNKEARSINDAAVKVANTLIDRREACDAVARLAGKYRRSGRYRPEKHSEQNSDLKQRRAADEAAIENPSKDSAC
jgi:hypothetical protein